MTDRKIKVYLIPKDDQYSIGKLRSLIWKSKLGKPYFRQRENGFLSISHSGDYFAFAVADCEIGIDLQKHDEKQRDYEKIISLFFHDHERAYIFGGKEGEFLTRFFHVWTAKESYVKFTGTGMDDHFAQFSVLDLENECHFYYVEDVGAQYTLCVCSKEEKEIKLEIESKEFKNGKIVKR